MSITQITALNLFCSEKKYARWGEKEIGECRESKSHDYLINESSGALWEQYQTNRITGLVYNISLVGAVEN